MKVLLISHSDAPFDGWGRYTAGLRSGLKKGGVEVKISLPSFFPSEKKLSGPLSYLWPPFSLLSLIKWREDLRTVQRMCDEFKPDIIHVTVEPYMFLLPYLNLKNTKTIITLHGTYAFIPNVVYAVLKPFYKRIMLRAFNSVEVIVSVSYFTKKYLLADITRSELNSEKIVVIPNGVELPSNNDLISNSHGKKIILTVGAVKRRKGILEALRAVAEYKKKYKLLFEYRIVGSFQKTDAYFRELQEFIEEVDIKEEVVFLGSINDVDLQKEYRSADLFLLLPIEDRNRFEGFGLVYLEANSFGVPAIGSLGAGSEEAVKNDFSGFVVDPRSKEEVAEKIHGVLEENAIDRKNCLAWAEEHALEKTAKQYLSLYEKIMNLPSPIK